MLALVAAAGLAVNGASAGEVSDEGCADAITDEDGMELVLVGQDELEQSFWLITGYIAWLTPWEFTEVEQVTTIGFYRGEDGDIYAIRCGVEYRVAS